LSSDIEPVIRVRNLGKRYRLQHYAPYRTLAETITNAFKRKREGSFAKTEQFWALKDVTFDVHQGEVVGIIGRNGAGKSTLLKVLSRITTPTEGICRIHGRVGSLLEVGTGFHPELSGRENIFLSGSILGMRKKEINDKFDEIVKFAEIEKFLDTPVKRFSSGMYVRLAFAVAAHLEPEILLVDEVLAVGDALFQKKCLGKMKDVAQEGRTVLFVSHNSNAITSLCTRALWIDEGKIVEDAEAKQVVGDYLGQMQAGFISGKSAGNEVINIEKIFLKNQRGETKINFSFGDDLIIDIFYRTTERLIRPKFWIGINSQFGAMFGANMLLDDCSPEYLEKEGSISCIFYKLPLLPQQYTIVLGIRDQYGSDNLIKAREVGFFNIVGSMKEIGFAGPLADALGGSASPIVLAYEWQFPKNRGTIGELSSENAKKEG
jgi:lipopolysaccharide transport system ATP-binding protein